MAEGLGLIDTHVHLEMREFDPDRGAVVQRAKGSGIGIITVGIDLESSARAVELAEEFGLYAAVGVHPHEAKRYTSRPGEGPRQARGAGKSREGRGPR
jgi:TatD DNase family protein